MLEEADGPSPDADLLHLEDIEGRDDVDDPAPPNPAPRDDDGLNQEAHKEELKSRAAEAKEFEGGIDWLVHHRNYLVDLMIVLVELYREEEDERGNKVVVAADGQRVPEEDAREWRKLVAWLETSARSIEQVLPTGKLQRPTERRKCRYTQKMPLGEETMVVLRDLVKLIGEQFVEVNKCVGSVIDVCPADQRRPFPPPPWSQWLLLCHDGAMDAQKEFLAGGGELAEDEPVLIPLASTFPVKGDADQYNEEQRQRMHWLNTHSKEAYDALDPQNKEKRLIEAIFKADVAKFYRMDWKRRTNRPYEIEGYEGRMLGAAYVRHNKMASEGKIWKPDYLAAFSDDEVRELIDKDNKTGSGGPKVKEIVALELSPWYFAFAFWIRMRRILEHQTAFLRQRNALIAAAKAAGLPPPSRDSLPGVPASQIDLSKPPPPLEGAEDGGARFSKKKVSSTPTSDKIANKTHEWRGGELVEREGEIRRALHKAVAEKKAAEGAGGGNGVEPAEDVVMVDAAPEVAVDPEPGRLAPEDADVEMDEADPEPPPAQGANADAKSKYDLNRLFAIGHAIGTARFSLRCICLTAVTIMELMERWVLGGSTRRARLNRLLTTPSLLVSHPSGAATAASPPRPTPPSSTRLSSHCSWERRLAWSRPSCTSRPARRTAAAGTPARPPAP